MKLGIRLPHYGRPIEVPRILEVARHAETRGLDSIWVTDHRALGCGHIALEVSYSTFPAIHDPIDTIGERLRPAVAD